MPPMLGQSSTKLIGCLLTMDRLGIIGTLGTRDVTQTVSKGCEAERPAVGRARTDQIRLPTGGGRCRGERLAGRTVAESQTRAPYSRITKIGEENRRDVRPVPLAAPKTERYGQKPPISRVIWLGVKTPFTPLLYPPSNPQEPSGTPTTLCLHIDSNGWLGTLGFHFEAWQSGIALERGRGDSPDLPF
jgi:hypothetical protein